MIPLLLILAPVLRSEAAVKTINLYHGPGDDAVLPCVSVSHLDAPSCSNIIWLYKQWTEPTLQEVVNGKVRTDSVRAARLDVDTTCSLIVRNITAEDAGFYTCRQGEYSYTETFVYLSVLTISPAPPDADPKSDGNVTLLCTLFRNSRLDQCKQNSIRWLDETGAELQELTQRNCVSALSVKHQRGPNRRLRCQYVEDQSVRIEVHYPPVSTDPTDWSPLRSIMVTLRVSGLILMIGVTVLIITDKAIKQSLRDKRIRYHGDVTADCEDE
ncbi:uncharacterized protein LOC114849245 isoform X1 [Betta splendens]|uniref:Uncharacterized protein LOC114849245 isoform X1 n=1 Tax=Betta splendens TaxID=158456 RepID=A0A9W2XLA2_BETSP|nr:uncharacterized protein LOC114849245 isoform X1 [Betta splendens]